MFRELPWKSGGEGAKKIEVPCNQGAHHSVQGMQNGK